MYVKRSDFCLSVTIWDIFLFLLANLNLFVQRIQKWNSCYEYTSITQTEKRWDNDQNLEMSELQQCLEIPKIFFSYEMVTM